MPASENVAVIVEEPTDEEVNAAITGNMGHLVTVVCLIISWFEITKPYTHYRSVL